MKRRTLLWNSLKSVLWVGFLFPVVRFLGFKQNLQRTLVVNRPAAGIWVKDSIVLKAGPDGQLEVFSAKCTHLGCRVHFLPDNHFFECPCHGSRYDAEGQVIRGPARRPLRRLPFRWLKNGKIEITLISPAQKS
ncbi:MAG: hypothetical protein D6814_16685 [Calditrichaeota bacterium]|nr:MAG: hypothetical protein D6814_16685 [Calditrichota bacterium]